jgi:hypothetical protein
VWEQREAIQDEFERSGLQGVAFDGYGLTTVKNP